MVSSSVFKALLVSFALSGGAGAACTRYIEAHQGDTCAILASAAGITVAQFLRSNPGVSSCNQLVNGGNYCIEGVADSAPQASTSTSSSRPSQTSSPGRLTISTDGNCGNGVTCLGSTFGNCCSQFGFCGATADYCLSEGCQTAFGLCGAGAISSSAGPSITPPPGPTVTVTVTSVGAVTRTSLVYETRTTTTAATVLTTQTVRVTASTTVTNTVAQSVAITATATTTRTIQTVATVTSTVLQTSAAVITRTSTVPATSYNIITLTTIETKTSTVPATSYDIITLTTIETKAITITSTTLRTSTITTTTTRVIQTVIPVTETLTSIVTSVSTRFITAVTGACSTTPTRPSLVTTTQASGGRPTPLLPGTPSNCRNFAVIRGDDTCRTLAQSNGLTLLQFYDLNPSVGTDAGILGLFCTIDLLDLLLSGLCQINCDQLWEGYYVCVGK